jgi:hypothetical protein
MSPLGRKPKFIEQCGGQAHVAREWLPLLPDTGRLAEDYRALLMTRKLLASATAMTRVLMPTRVSGLFSF